MNAPALLMRGRASSCRSLPRPAFDEVRSQRSFRVRASLCAQLPATQKQLFERGRQSVVNAAFELKFFDDPHSRKPSTRTRVRGVIHKQLSASLKSRIARIVRKMGMPPISPLRVKT